MSFSKDFSSFLIKIVVLSLLLAGGHYLLSTNTSITPGVADVFRIHVFIVILTVAVYATVVAVGRVNYDRAGFAFLGLSLIKLMISVAFLWPSIKGTGEADQLYVFNFFAVYFIFLVFELREVVVLIKRHAP